MKKVLRKRELFARKFIKKCPNGGYCINPICMFGCIDC